MPTCVFLNGKFYGGIDGPPPQPPAPLPSAIEPVSGAQVSAFDAGFQHAVGLFETMLGGVLRRGVEGPRSHGEETETWVIHLDEHMERLAASARELGLSNDLRVSALEEAVLETVRRSGLDRARVRLTVTAGDLSLLISQGKHQSVDPTVMIVAQPATHYPEPMFEKGVAITLAGSRANPLGSVEGHKTLSYWWRLRELQIAAAKGAAEALVLSITNHVASGCVSNVLLVKGGAVYTPIARGDQQSDSGNPPAVPSPVLPGITRAWVLERSERLGLSVHTRMLSVQDVLDADEVMLTNSSWGILPVVKLEANEIGSGQPGRVTLDLLDQWRDLQPQPDDEL